jgi:glycosyltransferase involved in cell wall biosynthesis
MTKPPVRISVLIPTRGRIAGLVYSIRSLAERASGNQEIRYVVGIDADDAQTVGMALALRGEGHNVVPCVVDRQPTLGGLVNILAERCPGDVYLSWGDDFRALTDGWDDIVAETWRAKDDHIWWWRSEPQVTLAIISEKWRQAAGRLYTEYFPFWYDDLWLIEVLHYATGETKCTPMEAWIKDRARATHRMRDCQFWDDFFWSKREERKAEAARIAEKLGWPKVEWRPELDVTRNSEFNPDELEARQGDQNPVTPEYLIALNRAKALTHKEVA